MRNLITLLFTLSLITTVYAGGTIKVGESNPPKLLCSQIKGFLLCSDKKLYEAVDTEKHPQLKKVLNHINDDSRFQIKKVPGPQDEEGGFGEIKKVPGPHDDEGGIGDHMIQR